MIARVACCLLAVTTACVADGIAPEAPAPTIMTIAGDGPETIFAMYRAGDGPWRRAPATGSGFALEVTDDYILVTACSSANGTVVEELAATAADGPGAGCAITSDDGGGAVAPDPVTATGTMAQAGTVSLGGTSDTSGAPGWRFALDVAPGTHDLLAIGADGRAVVRRDLRVDGATPLPPVDVASGAPMIDAPIAGATADHGESVFADSWLSTKHGTFVLSQDATAQAVLAPPSQVAAGDTQGFELDLDGNDTSRGAVWSAPGPAAPPPSVALLPRIAGAAFTFPDGAIAATWPPLGAPVDRIELRVDGSWLSQHVIATASWLARHPDGALALDASAPGYAQRWRLAAGFVQLTALRRDAAANVSYATTTYVDRTL